jgi:hypothetical protein
MPANPQELVTILMINVGESGGAASGRRPED